MIRLAIVPTLTAGFFTITAMNRPSDARKPSRASVTAPCIRCMRRLGLAADAQPSRISGTPTKAGIAPWGFGGLAELLPGEIADQAFDQGEQHANNNRNPGHASIVRWAHLRFQWLDMANASSIEISICSYSFHRLLAAGKQDIIRYIADCAELGCTQLDPWNGAPEHRLDAG